VDLCSRNGVLPVKVRVFRVKERRTYILGWGSAECQAASQLEFRVFHPVTGKEPIIYSAPSDDDKAREKAGVDEALTQFWDLFAPALQRSLDGVSQNYTSNFRQLLEKRYLHTFVERVILTQELDECTEDEEAKEWMTVHNWFYTVRERLDRLKDQKGDALLSVAMEMEAGVISSIALAQLNHVLIIQLYKGWQPDDRAIRVIRDLESRQLLMNGRHLLCASEQERQQLFKSLPGWFDLCTITTVGALVVQKHSFFDSRASLSALAKGIFQVDITNPRPNASWFENVTDDLIYQVVLKMCAMRLFHQIFGAGINRAA